MALSRKSSLDYEALVRTFCIKDAELEKLDEEKRSVIVRFQKTFQEFLEAYKESEVVDQKNRESRSTLKYEKLVLKKLEDEMAVWDQMLEANQGKIKALKEVIKKDALRFRENCEMLYVQHENLVKELDNETISKEISKVSANLEVLNKASDEMVLELQRVKDLPQTEFNRNPAVKELTETLEKESVELSGRPHELKKKLKELEQSTNNLKEQIRKLKLN